MPGISIHAVDVSRGVVAAGMRIQVLHEEVVVASAPASSKGLLEIKTRVQPGSYEAVFHVARWYRSQRVRLPSVPFLDVVTYRFGISYPGQHYHLPFKFTPWGFSCFRGGA